MTDNEDRMNDVDQTLAEVRRDLEFANSTGDVYELRALQLLLQVTKAMHSEHDIYSLITYILDSALSFAEADRAFLMLLDDNGVPRFKMGRSYDGRYLPEDHFVISSGAVQDALESLQPLIVSDALQDQEFNKRQSVQDLELRTIMAAPLRFKKRTLGLIYVDSNRPLTRYSKHHVNVMSSLADQAAIAIANVQKFETHHG